MKALARIGAVLVIIGILNFIAFAIITGCIGGSALNGRVDQGKYFVSEHGKDTEVTEAVFFYSRAHSISVFVTHGLAFVGFIICWGYSASKAKNTS